MVLTCFVSGCKNSKSKSLVNRQQLKAAKNCKLDLHTQCFRPNGGEKLKEMSFLAKVLLTNKLGPGNNKRVNIVQ